MRAASKNRKHRRFIAAVVCFAVMLCLCGCSSIFDKEYSVVTDHKGEYLEPEEDNYTAEVRNYAGMRSAVLNMVSSGLESYVITTDSYSGDVREDISRACLEVTRETPIGVYAVEYMTHVCSQILSYYRIEVFVTYKRTAEEIASIVTVNSGPALVDAVLLAAADYQSSATYNLVASNINEDELIQAVTREYRNDAMLLTELPDISYTCYPNDEAVQRIVELYFTYSAPIYDLRPRRTVMLSRAGGMISSLGAFEDEKDPLEVCLLLCDKCSYEADGGKTAYDAIVNSSANSEGLAMAYKLLCSLSGIECVVVEGRYSSEPHFWNIIELDGDFYHVDVSRCITDGPDAAFMRRDSDMWGEYWWDTELYSPCNGTLTYYDMIQTEALATSSEETLEESSEAMD